MGKIEVDVDEEVARVIDKQARTIEHMQKKNVKLEEELADLKRRFKALKELRDKVVETAYQIDDYYHEDD